MNYGSMHDAQISPRVQFNDFLSISMFLETSCMPFNLVAGVAAGTSVQAIAANVAGLVPWLNFAIIKASQRGSLLSLDPV